MDFRQEIEQIDIKLKDMRIRYKASSPSMQKFLAKGGLLLLDKKKRLQAKLEQEKQEVLW